MDELWLYLNIYLALQKHHYSSIKMLRVLLWPINFLDAWQEFTLWYSIVIFTERLQWWATNPVSSGWTAQLCRSVALSLSTPNFSLAYQAVLPMVKVKASQKGATKLFITKESFRQGKGRWETEWWRRRAGRDFSHQKQGNCGERWEGTEIHRKDTQLSTICVLMLRYSASLMALSLASLALPKSWEKYALLKRDLIEESQLFNWHLLPKQQH